MRLRQRKIIVRLSIQKALFKAVERSVRVINSDVSVGNEDVQIGQMRIQEAVIPLIVHQLAQRDRLFHNANGLTRILGFQRKIPNVYHHRLGELRNLRTYSRPPFVGALVIKKREQVFL